MKNFSIEIISLGLILLLGAIALPTFAAQCSLAWDPVDDPRVVGYRVYFGQAHRNYDQWVDVGNATSYVVSDLDPDQVHYFAVKSYDGTGQESDLSSEVTSGYFRFVIGIGSDSLDSGQLVVLNQNQDAEQKVSVALSTGNKLSGAARVATGDIDGDGLDEVVIGFSPVDHPGGRFLVLDDDFSIVRWGQVDWPDYNAANGETRPALGDIDGDGKHEIVIGLGAGGNGMLQIFRLTDGNLVSMGWTALGWSEYGQANGETWPSLGDIDADGLDELAIGVGSGGGGALVIKTGLDASSLQTGGDPDWLGEIQSSVPWAEYAAQIGETRPALGDLNGDGSAEVVVGLGQSGGGYLEIFDYKNPALFHVGTASIHWPDYNAQNGETRPAVGDIDQDRRDEIIVGLGTGGGGYVDLLDDESWQYASLGMLQIGSAAYQSAGGETWPSFKRERLAAAPPVDYRLSVIQDGTGSGTVGGGGLYPAGTIVSPTAGVAADSTFAGWTPVSCGAPFALTGDTTCTATFMLLPRYALTVSRSGSGTVASSTAGISCGSDCTESYASGAAVTLTAAAEPGSTFDGWSGHADCADGQVTLDADRQCTATFNLSIEDTQINAAILPYARAIPIGATATVFASVINSGNATASDCSIALPGGVPATFSYKTTNAANALIGIPNSPVDIAPGATQGFVFAITPSQTMAATEIPIVFDCANTAQAPSYPGLNTFILSAAASAPPDLLAIGATPSGDGVVRLPNRNGTGFFATAAVNIGSAGPVTVSADDGGRGLPLTLQVCETTSAGQWIACGNSLTRSVGAGQTAYYSVFATGTGQPIAFDPANNRLFLRFASNGTTVGATNVAVTAP